MPVSTKNKVVDDLKDHRADLSVSRPSSRISWAIPVPGDSSQTIYVWLDALTNYLSVVNFDKENVKNFVHFIGKDISKFHCIYWPSFLQSAFGGSSDFFPSMIFSHGHWLKDNKKMSKTIGNVVDPLSIIDKYGIDSVRLYFLSQGPLHQDIDFIEDNLLHTHNKFLIDSYMNLLFRIASKKVIKKLGETIQRPDEINGGLMIQVNEQVEIASKHFERYDFINAFRAVEQIVFLGNQDLSVNEFWTLLKSDDIDSKKKLEGFLYTTMEIMKTVSILLQPYCPRQTDKVLTFLRV